MATQMLPSDKQKNADSRLPVFLRPYSNFVEVFGGIGLAMAATLTLLGIGRTNLWFPILSAIAFPAMAISPFLIMRAQIPLQIKLAIILVLGLLVVPFLGLRDTFYLELAIQIAIFAALALGLNIVVGFAGLLDLGYVAF